MKTALVLLLFCAAIPAFAVRGGMEKATVHAMRKVPCTEGQASGRGGIFASAVTNECVEYEIRTEKVSYIIRPSKAILLLLGGDVFIKFAQSELLLHTSDSAKDVRCEVLAMVLRSEVERQERAQTVATRPVVTRCYAESGREIPCPDEP